VSFEVGTGPRGPAPTWNGRRLTSAYDPAREAQSWADGLTIAAGALVFVAGDPLGWAAQALEKRGAKAVSLLPGSGARPWIDPALQAWSPQDGPLEAFLEEVFDRWGPEAVVWEVWPAFERLAPEVALDWGRRFRDFYRTVQGSWLTQNRFGRRFWRNSVRNTLDWDHPIRLTAGNRPVVIAASGPSLDDGLAFLTRGRHRFDLWALPSSFETLIRRGLVPDAGVATDGGFYAREHLQRLAGTEVPMLAALSSAPDPVLAARPCLFFSQGMPVEQALLTALMPSFPEVPSQGTVAVTALRLALEATTGPVFIAGLDLAFRDLRGHTSPHTVDRRFETLQDRLAPEESLWAQRLFDQATVVHEGVRTSPALLTYAGWFRTRARFSRPVFRIAPSPLRWGTMTEVGWPQAEALWNGHPGQRAGVWTTPSSWPDRSARRRAVLKSLDDLAARAEAPGRNGPWLTEAAKTAVPEALREDFRILRRGGEALGAQAALRSFLEELREDLGP
jgi:hypothetical protein